VFVDRAVAVAVDAIALGPVRDGAGTGHTCAHHAARARRHRVRAGANAAGEAAQAVVDHAIAVVIQVVAGFAAGRHLAGARSPHACCARLVAGKARPDPGRPGRPRITRLRGGIPDGIVVVIAIEPRTHAARAGAIAILIGIGTARARRLTRPRIAGPRA